MLYLARDRHNIFGDDEMSAYAIATVYKPDGLTEDGYSLMSRSGLTIGNYKSLEIAKADMLKIAEAIGAVILTEIE